MSRFRWATDFAAAALVALCCVMSAMAQSPAPPFPVEGRILFNRWAYQSPPQNAYNRLWRTDADGTDLVPLVPVLAGNQYIEPDWSLDGQWIAYIDIDAPPRRQRNVFVQDANGSPASRRRLTPTSGEYYAPSWSPDGRWIAYNDATDFCVHIVRRDGSERRTVWCLGGSGYFFLHAPVWSANGSCIFIPSAVLGEDLLRYQAWRVNITTLAATHLLAVDDVFGPSMWISPNGRKALFADEDATVNGMLLIDIATGVRTPLGTGHTPLFSRDSRKLAFSRTDFPQIVGDPESTHVYVMDIDGTHVKRLTFAQIDQLRYSAADWSLDNKRLLVNRVITIPDANIPGLPYRRSSAQMRIFDIATRTVWRLPGVGTATTYGWYQEE